MHRIIVTGATSMIGVALVEEALQHGIEVYAVVRPDSKRLDRLPHNPTLHIIECELEHLSFSQGISQKCDALYHFAWAGTEKQKRDNPLIQESNIRFTMDAVELAYKSGCKKFIGAGSQAEYGWVNGVIDSRTKFNPESAYGAAKYAAGLLSKKLCEQYGMIHIWGRIFSVYGRYDNEGTLLDYAIKCFLRREKAFFSAGTQMWDYLNERDAGMLFIKMGELCEENKSFHVAYGKSIPLREYISCVAGIMNGKDLCSFDQHDMSIGKRGIEVDISETVKELGYSPSICFAEGILSVIEEYKRRNIQNQ